jgi:asparaginyl-tRNA synthetase
MLSEAMSKLLYDIDITLVGEDGHAAAPDYDPLTHYLEVAQSPYYHHLIDLRHIMKALCDDYMSTRVGAKNIDLFMLTPSVSSPMGPGSDSEAIPIKFGKLTSYLTDSSQFGFEPIIMNGIDKAYCYLPSMRGEDPDKRHLNQFFHCEAEIRGGLEDVMELAENYVKHLSLGMMQAPHLIARLSKNPTISKQIAQLTAQTEKFKRITFDDACKLLQDNGYGEFVNTTPKGRDISSQGELALMRILKLKVPIWITHFDRNRVPFYQKPDPKQPTKVLNADLLFPPIIEGSFGGEILGAGQRQDTALEMYESLSEQGLSAKPYEWYINLRNDARYMTTAGFGLGIERYIAWILGLDNIQDAILYPRLKNVLTTP